MVDNGRSTGFFVSATAATLISFVAGMAWAQPPVAKPQPPPKAPASGTTPSSQAPAKPATAAAAPAGGTQSGATTTTAPAAPPTARPAAPAAAAPAPTVPAPSSAVPVAASRAGSEVDQPPAESALGVTVLPNAQFLGSYDAGGAGQRFYLFGTVQRFDDVVSYYRTLLRDKGELVFEFPATHMFEVGKFREDQVAFPPGVTVKDYTFGGSPGLTNPRPGATPRAFPTIIQIVPPAIVQPARPR